MTVSVNSERTGVEIQWDPAGSGGGEEAPPGFPTHPIYLPPYVDNTLPGDQPEVDNELPGEQPKPEHPIYLPPYVDNSLPGRGSAGGEHPDHELPEIPPDLGEGIPPEQLEKIKDFLLGNLPPFEGGPEYPAPVHTEALAVQVFGQGQAGDWSNTAVMPNDGLAFLSYPKGFSGESYIEVRALDGSLVDSGVIQVGEAQE